MTAMKRALAVALAAGIMLGLCSCGGASKPAKTAASTASVTPSPTPTPTPTAMTIKQAATAYDALAAREDASIHAMNKLFVTQHSHDMKRLKADARAVSRAHWTFARAVQATQWPPSVAKQAAAVVAAAVKEQDYWDDIAASRNYDQFVTAWLKLQDTKFPAYNTLLLALGLSPRGIA